MQVVNPPSLDRPPFSADTLKPRSVPERSQMDWFESSPHGLQAAFDFTAKRGPASITEWPRRSLYHDQPGFSPNFDSPGDQNYTTRSLIGPPPHVQQVPLLGHSPDHDDPAYEGRFHSDQVAMTSSAAPEVDALWEQYINGDAPAEGFQQLGRPLPDPTGQPVLALPSTATMPAMPYRHSMAHSPASSSSFLGTPSGSSSEVESYDPRNEDEGFEQRGSPYPSSFGSPSFLPGSPNLQYPPGTHLSPPQAQYHGGDSSRNGMFRSNSSSSSIASADSLHGLGGGMQSLAFAHQNLLPSSNAYGLGQASSFYNEMMRPSFAGAPSLYRHNTEVSHARHLASSETSSPHDSPPHLAQATFLNSSLHPSPYNTVRAEKKAPRSRQSTVRARPQARTSPIFRGDLSPDRLTSQGTIRDADTIVNGINPSTTGKFQPLDDATDFAQWSTKKSRGRRPLDPTALGLASGVPDAADPNFEPTQEQLEFAGTTKAGKPKKIFVCKVQDCGKCFKRSEHLKRHVRSLHTNEKPFRCPWDGCDKRFSRVDNLNQHIRVHERNPDGIVRNRPTGRQSSGDDDDSDADMPTALPLTLPLPARPVRARRGPAKRYTDGDDNESDDDYQP